MNDMDALLMRTQSANKDFSWMSDGAGLDALSKKMQESYDSVAERASPTQHLHVINRFPITLEAWDTICRTTSELLKIKPDDTVFGDRSQVFRVLSLVRIRRGMWLWRLAGVDQAAIFRKEYQDGWTGLCRGADRHCEKASTRRVHPCQRGVNRDECCEHSEWSVGDARCYSQVPDSSFDVSVSFGVFVYFDSDAEVRNHNTILSL